MPPTDPPLEVTIASLAIFQDRAAAFQTGFVASVATAAALILVIMLRLLWPLLLRRCMSSKDKGGHEEEAEFTEHEIKTIITKQRDVANIDSSELLVRFLDTHFTEGVDDHPSVEANKVCVGLVLACRKSAALVPMTILAVLTTAPLRPLLTAQALLYRAKMAKRRVKGGKGVATIGRAGALAQLVPFADRRTGDGSMQSQLTTIGIFLKGAYGIDVVRRVLAVTPTVSLTRDSCTP